MKKINNIDINIHYEDIGNELARRNIIDYSKAIYPDHYLEPFHVVYYKILDLFAKGSIKNLMVSMPSQHGKSTGSSMILPSYIFGINPDCRIALASYSSTFARKFNRANQRIIDSSGYRDIFPDTRLNEFNVVSSGRWLRNTDEFEIVGKEGGLLVAGRGGPLSGNKVDVMIMDDLYKDSAEGNSPVVRDSVIEWYSSVIEKRLHNDSQQLIVFTRWHEDDLIGYLENESSVIEVKSWDDIERIESEDNNTWVKINFEAIKESDKTELDSRELNEALWEGRHSIEKLKKERQKQPHIFNCMSQGRPGGSEGLLYEPFRTYDILPNTIKKGNYTDTADMGDDYLCSICYEVDNANNIYLTDIVYTQEPIENTEGYVVKMLLDNNTRESDIESNAGGRAFARNVQNIIGMKCNIEWFHQSNNKESRILTNSGQANKVLMPIDWFDRWPIFYNHLTKFKRTFRSNRHDDAPDCLTGIVEMVIKEDYDVFA